jgi:hypothetical protein
MARLRAEDAEKRAASGYGPVFLEAFARGLRVIGAFGREKKHMTLSDVARATDLPKPSARRALYTLTCLGLAASDGRTFRLTPRIMELASAYLGSNMVSTVVQPACERIGDRTEQSCFAAVLDGYDIVMIAHSLHGRPDVLAPTMAKVSSPLSRPFCLAPLRPEAERPTKACSKSGVQPLGVIESTSSTARIALPTASPSRVMAALSWRAALANF